MSLSNLVLRLFSSFSAKPLNLCTALEKDKARDLSSQSCRLCLQLLDRCLEGQASKGAHSSRSLHIAGVSGGPKFTPGSEASALLCGPSEAGDFPGNICLPPQAPTGICAFSGLGRMGSGVWVLQIAPVIYPGS